MKLPDIEYGPVERSSDTAPLAGEAAQRMTSVIAEGLTRYGQELVKTKTASAMVDVQEGLAKLEQELNASPYVSAKYVREQLGNDLSKLPAELRAQLTTRAEDGTEGDQEQLPAWAFAGAIYDKRARDLVAAASRNIPGPGWQASFQDAARADVASKAVRFNAEQLRGLHAYLATQQGADVQRLANAGDFGGAIRLLDSSSAIDPADRVKMKASLEAHKEAAPVLRAIQARDLEVLKKAKEDLLDPKKFPAMTQEQRTELSGHVDHVVGNLEVAESARMEEDRVWRDAGGDPSKALELVDAIPDTKLRDATELRVKRRLEDQRALRAAADSPRVARLRVAMSRSGTLDRGSDDYLNLSDEGQAQVEADWRAERRASKAVGTSERREQDRADRDALVTYRALPELKQKVAVDVDNDPMFRGVSEGGRNAIKIQQNKDRIEYSKDAGVSEKEFKAKVVQVAEGLKGMTGASGAGKRKMFVDYMLGERSTWMDAHPEAKAMPQEVLTKMLSDAVAWGDAGHWYSVGGEYAYQAKLGGREFVPKGTDQPGVDLLRRLGIVPGAATNTGPQPVRPMPRSTTPAADRRPRRTDPKTGETRAWNGSAWVKE